MITKYLRAVKNETPKYLTVVSLLMEDSGNGVAVWFKPLLYATLLDSITSFYMQHQQMRIRSAFVLGSALEFHLIYTRVSYSG